jgi:hypothetical protein
MVAISKVETLGKAEQAAQGLCLVNRHERFGTLLRLLMGRALFFIFGSGESLYSYYLISRQHNQYPFPGFSTP